jgi:general secretion pathway protein H
MLVLLVIGLFSVLIIPNLTGPLTRVELKTCAKRVAAALRYAASRAAAEKTTSTALFDVEKRRLIIISRVRQMPDPGNPDQESRDADASDNSPDIKIRKNVYNLPEGIRFNDLTSMIKGKDENIFLIYFYPDGRSSGGALSILDDRESGYRLNIDFITGEVTLKG